ncbi:MAG: hypothetical protein U5K30_05850 [Acidimicrobiales bacterium]|nr:hypothetical protein [Acidimicrobiales bacterium]
MSTDGEGGPPLHTFHAPRGMVASVDHLASNPGVNAQIEAL